VRGRRERCDHCHQLQHVLRGVDRLDWPSLLIGQAGPPPHRTGRGTPPSLTISLRGVSFVFS
jgi:hypothetical protein